jgi:hypothetical protein
MLAALAHERGLSIGLKNDLNQIGDLLPDFDFAVNEQCAEYGECPSLAPFVRTGKAVFHVEYNLGNSTFCPQTTALGFSSMRKKKSLERNDSPADRPSRSPAARVPGPWWRQGRRSRPGYEPGERQPGTASTSRLNESRTRYGNHAGGGARVDAVAGQGR